MDAIVKKFEMKNVKLPDGRSFDKVKVTADVIDETKNNEVRTLSGEFNPEFLRKYFAFCGVNSRDLIGKKVDVILHKRAYDKDGQTRQITFIKYLNVLDADEKPIIMPKEEKENEALDF